MEFAKSAVQLVKDRKEKDKEKVVLKVSVLQELTEISHFLIQPDSKFSGSLIIQDSRRWFEGVSWSADGYLGIPGMASRGYFCLRGM